MNHVSWLVWLAALYVAGLWLWVALHALFGERWGWLFLLNSFALELFVPLPLALLVAAWARQPVLFGAALAALAYGMRLFGWMVLPRRAAAPADGTVLTVMTANLLGHHEHPAEVATAMRRATADVIAVQELNLPAAEAMVRELRDAYPYQYLIPFHGDAGMGVASRYPMRPLNVMLPGDWLGAPQMLLLDVHGQDVLLINMHTMSPRFNNMTWTVQERERQARTLVEFVAQQGLPTIVLGDFNAGDQSRAYQIMRQCFRAAWREAGRGPGHTFPGADVPGGSRRIVAGIRAPQWLVRIDYIFCTSDWHVAQAQFGPWDGVSDHRSVEARLVLP